MISISTQSASEYFVVLEEKPESEIERYSRRNSVRSTLDGGGVPSDSGYSDTDRNIIVHSEIHDSKSFTSERIHQGRFFRLHDQ